MAKRKVEITVEKGIPISSQGQGKYPFDEMESGDSFFVPMEMANRSAVSVAVNRYRGITPGTNYTTRKVTEGDVVGTRVWRIK